MPQIVEAIQKRRSVRKYLPHPVPKELVLEVLAAAGWAPSAHNSQPWRFIVIDDPKIKRSLSEAMGRAWATDLVKDGLAVNEDSRKERVERFANAPVLILGCLTMEGLRTFPDAARQGFERDLAVQSYGAAIQNILLAAFAQKLVSCWFCAPGFCKQTVRDVLKIPLNIEPQSFVILGYTGECPQTPPKNKLTDYCYLDIWGKPLK